MTTLCHRGMLTALLSAGLFLLVATGPALAHPLGLPAVARVAATDTGTVMVWWSAPADDLADLAAHLGIVEVEVVTAREDGLVSQAAAMREALLSGIRVSQDGQPCPGQVRVDSLLVEGAFLQFACPTARRPVTLTVGVLAPVDERYATLVAAGTTAGLQRYTAVGRDTVELSLDPVAADDVMLGSPVLAAGSDALESSLPFEAGLIGLVEGPIALPAALLGMLAALGVGLAHGALPGHGKTVAAAYLVGDRARRRDAVLLGTSVAVMHTGSVLVLGLALYGVTRQPQLATLSGWLQVVAGVVIVVVGLALLRRRIRDGGHRHGPHHHHVVRAEASGGLWAGSRLVALGAAGGLLPSPTALLVLLTALATDHLAYGLVLVGLFGLGLAITVTLAGFAVLWGRDRALTWLSRRPGGRRLQWVLAQAPLAATGVVVALGVLIATRGALTL